MNDEGKRRNFLPFLVIQLTAVLALLFFVAFMVSRNWTVVRAIGLLLMITSVILLFTARWQLGDSFTARAEARQLVTHGLYSRIRNPIYVFSGLMVLGLFMVLGNPYLYIFLAPLLFVQTMRAKKESRVLEAKFGEQYRAYRKHTWL